MRHSEPPSLAGALEQGHSLPTMCDALERASQDVALAGEHHVGLAHRRLVAGAGRCFQGPAGRRYRGVVVAQGSLQVGEPEEMEADQRGIT